MAIRGDLRAKLKASKKRRQRRARNQPQPKPTKPAQPTQVDVTGLIVSSLIGLCNRERRFGDAGAVGALRACLTGNPPSGKHARSAYVACQDISAREDISDRAFHVAIKDLLEIASERQSRDNEMAFLAYLSLFAE